jgi:hypothetical protein
MSHDALGHLRWKETFGGPVGGNDRPQSVAVNDCGRVYVSGYGWNPPHNSDGIILHYTQVEPGDLDRDGEVNLLDFAVLQAGFGRAGVTPQDGDIDVDGDVDTDDFRLLEAKLSGPCS